MRPVMCQKRGCGITLDDLEAKLVANYLFSMLHSRSQRMDKVLLATINQKGVHGYLPQRGKQIFT